MKATLISILFFLCFLPSGMFAQLTPHEAALLMQKGINLGNTLEPPLEGGWNNPAAQEYYFDMYKQAGFSTVRLPVRWDKHTAESGDFKIDEPWLERVGQIIDWAIERDLFIIVNAHHEDWLKQNYSNALYRARFDSIWSQISSRFKDKSQKLVFEIINEPNGLTKAQNDELHARILSIIRKTNPTRLVVIQGHNWGGSDELIAAAVPNDNYLIGSFHSYDPYAFGLQGTGTWGTSSDYTILKTKFEKVKNWSNTTHIPVLLGEFGSLRTCDYNSRMKHYRAYVEYAQQFGFIACAWDDGGDFKIMERSAHQWDEVKDILIHTNALAPRNINLSIVQDTLIQLTWVNAVNDADSIYIEHKTGLSYSRISILKGDTTKFIHLFANQNIYHYYRIIAHYNDGQNLYSQPQRIFLPKYVRKVRSFYTGSPIPVPGTVEAECFDIGGEGLTYHDATETNLGGALRTNEDVDIFNTGAKYYVAHVAQGEWMEYTVNVAEEGDYKTEFQIAAQQRGGRFNIKHEAGTSPSYFVPGTGGPVNFTVITDTLHLLQGQQIFRFNVLNTPYFSFDKIVFSLLTTTPISEFQQPKVTIASMNGSIHVNLDNNKDIQNIKLFDVTGRIFYSVDHPDSYFMISNLKPGIYIVHAEFKNGKYSTAKCALR